MQLGIRNPTVPTPNSENPNSPKFESPLNINLWSSTLDSETVNPILKLGLGLTSSKSLVMERGLSKSYKGYFSDISTLRGIPTITI